MKALFLIAKYLPIVMGTVSAIEQNVQAPGKTKAAIALDTVKTAAGLVGQTVPEPHVQLITGLIDGIVDVFNRSGIFQKTVPPIESGAPAR
jgi:hypothetical protein